MNSNNDLTNALTDTPQNEKRIEVVTLKAREINFEFGNPRKISRPKKIELKASLETFGDFGLFIVDENNSVLAGNMRLQIIQEENPDTELLCKRLIGYTEAEKRAINIKDNQHQGEWDLNILSDWLSDLSVDLGLDKELKQELEDRDIKGMKLINYEKYNYVMIVCKTEMDYNLLTTKFGINGEVVVMSSKKSSAPRTIQARSIWFEDVKDKLK